MSAVALDGATVLDSNRTMSGCMCAAAPTPKALAAAMATHAMGVTLALVHWTTTKLLEMHAVGLRLVVVPGCAVLGR